ncbi:hypothetical protein C8Q74DRAFT_1306713 [Fomes fomentarius]|nr:hypothetical protein C8Q74DRAFT_1306713 [Fomes fomentarius]
MSAYHMTKAAALIATTKWALKLRDEGFVVVSLSPGLVDTTATMDDGRACHCLSSGGRLQENRVVDRPGDP